MWRHDNWHSTFRFVPLGSRVPDVDYFTSGCIGSDLCTSLMHLSQKIILVQYRHTKDKLRCPGRLHVGRCQEHSCFVQRSTVKQKASANEAPPSSNRVAGLANGRRREKTGGDDFVC